jgi:hypothetical protein
MSQSWDDALREAFAHAREANALLREVLQQRRKDYTVSAEPPVAAPVCCHKPHMVGAACPVGRQCPYDKLDLGQTSLPAQHTGVELERCPNCGGTGTLGYPAHPICSFCAGQGQIAKARTYQPTTPPPVVDCDRCSGTGGWSADNAWLKCPRCDGLGRVCKVASVPSNTPADNPQDFGTEKTQKG